MDQKNFAECQAKLMKRDKHLTTASWNVTLQKQRKVKGKDTGLPEAGDGDKVNLMKALKKYKLQVRG